MEFAAKGRSRTPVWVTALANTTIWVDLDGSGISCPSGAGSERSIAATALTSYRLVDDPAEIVRDEFSAQAYNNNDSPTGENWNTNWTETGTGETPTSASAGAIQINTTTDDLRFQSEAPAARAAGPSLAPKAWAPTPVRS